MAQQTVGNAFAKMLRVNNHPANFNDIPITGKRNSA
jgi:hypothetical protein